MLPKCHRYLIQNALNQAIGDVQNDLPEGVNCVLRLDQATDGRAGSIDIANTILEKISSSAVVVGDVTPVLINENRGWYYPNPNVMTEIGYAAGKIGWNRVICIYNTAICKAEQLPFDIRHRRVTGFCCNDESQRKQATSNLGTVLRAAIRAVIQEICRGEIDPSIDNASLRHKRDLRLLHDVMCSLHRPTLNRFIERGQVNQVHYDCLYFWHDFDAIVSSCEFRFYDKDLERLAIDLHRVWGDAIHYSAYAFGQGTTPGSLVLLPLHLWSDDYKNTVKEMERAYGKLPTALKAFLDHVHQHFQEINMNETDDIAWKRNLLYINGTATEPRLDDSDASIDEGGA